MKPSVPRPLALFLLAALLAGSGCVSTRDREVRQPDPRHLIRRPRPVHADEITAQNAHQMADAQWDELDFEVRGDSHAGLPTTTIPKKR
jgi:hypothetical protein